MLKLYVGDMSAGDAFYSTVLGAKLVAEMGTGVHIMTFPGGGPGVLLIQAGPDDAMKQGSFIFKVADLQATKALALANGATEQGTFAGTPGEQAAKSVDVLDPWGNQIEILQLG